jgi:hypothetical protein
MTVHNALLGIEKPQRMNLFIALSPIQCGSDSGNACVAIISCNKAAFLFLLPWRRADLSLAIRRQVRRQFRENHISVNCVILFVKPLLKRRF